MHSPICEYRDDGRAGDVFTSYEIVKPLSLQAYPGFLITYRIRDPLGKRPK